LLFVVGLLLCQKVQRYEGGSDKVAKIYFDREKQKRFGGHSILEFNSDSSITWDLDG
jgi:hypothetical protein